MRLSEVLALERVRVFKQDKLAGYLSRTKHGASFEYSDEYLHTDGPALSFHISKQLKSYVVSGENLHPFFAGLLPEGLRLNALVDTLKTSSSDLFSLLVASGSDLIGDVYVLPEEQPLKEPKLSIKSLAQVDFLQLFNQSIYSADYSVRRFDSSVAGIQPKLSARMISFPVGTTQRNKTYLLKLEPKEYPRIVANEHFFMQLAKQCGLAVAKTKIVQDRLGRVGLLVERFDRVYDKTAKQLKRYHQEDACQFLNLYPQDKYRLHFRQIAAGIKQFATAPIIETTKLLELLLFSYIIGNGDLHGKNISLMSLADPTYTVLTPGYDLLTTLPYGDQSLALAFEGKKDNLTRTHFLDFSKAFDVPVKVISSSIERISETIVNRLNDVEQIGLPAKKTKFLTRVMKQRILGLQRG